MNRLSKRDKAIIADLERFRCMDRDSIAELHFSNVKNPIQAANTVLVRLYRLGLCDRSDRYSPFVYFPATSKMKRTSVKIPHFLEILRVYKDMSRYKPVRLFDVEPVFGPKGTIEVDAEVVWGNAPFYLEVQRSIYSEKIMQEKIDRYFAWYHEGKWAESPYQNPERAIFPSILMITQTKYALDTYGMKLIQISSIDDLMVQLQRPVKPTSQNGTIKFNVK
jgi:hypothetical protein